MPWQAVLLLATAVLAAVAVTAAVVAVRAVREVRAARAQSMSRDLDTRPEAATRSPMPIEPLDGRVDREAVVSRPPELAPRLVEGRVIVPPTQAQVVRTALGRPGVRLNVLLFGLRHALEAENRDRIVALMRREYRHRRRQRLRAGRHAFRAAEPGSAASTDRLHEQLREPKPLTLAERMMS